MKEKEVQVARIADVYAFAQNVIVWLGEHNHHTRPAFQLLLDLAVSKDEKDILNDDERLAAWKSLAHVMKSSWFSRRWIIQELALARNAVVYCGNSGIHWNSLRHGISLFIENEEFLREKFHRSEAFNHDYHALEETEPLAAKILVEKVGNVFNKNTKTGKFVANKGLEGLVSSLSAFETSDPRDTINGLLNISKEGIGLADRYRAKIEGRSESMRQATMILDDVRLENMRIARVLHLGREPPPLPSHQKDLLDVYVSFVEWIVRTTGSIDMICRYWAIPERSLQVSGYPQLVKLPSWIKLTTDSPFKYTGQIWCRHNADSLVGLPGECPYNACGSRRQASIEISTQDISSLAPSEPISEAFRKTASAKVKGLKIGVINRCTDAMSGGNITMSALDLLGWKGVKAHMAHELQDEVWRPLVVGTGSDGKYPPSLWSSSCLEVLTNHTDDQSINIKLIMPRIKKRHTKEFLKRMQKVTWNRKFFKMKLEEVYRPAACTEDQAAIGLGPPLTQFGDIVCILYGCSVPCILRPRPNRDESGFDYEFVGECYVYGFMGGEAIAVLEEQELQDKEDEFTLV